jgi:hypothetical protein
MIMQVQDNNGNTAVPVKFVVGGKKNYNCGTTSDSASKASKARSSSQGGGNPKGGVEFPILFGID